MLIQRRLRAEKMAEAENIFDESQGRDELMKGAGEVAFSVVRNNVTGNAIAGR